ncbi:Ankyrin repeat protein [Mycena sanguinolenta]|uniref:Ankyrin repeat protein n=1 Tax=Mycena sanguinolenta TaxID=230812 RepID=A0A8H6Y3F1_9AGAR|nr:Ankyrin repeat protein [Mycena sanguinolenta]
MPDSPTRRLKSIITGTFRPRQSSSSRSRSVPFAVTNIPNMLFEVTPGAAVPFAAISHSTTSPGTSASIRGTPTAGVESRNVKTPLVDNLTLALDITEKLAAFAHQIPFIAPVAGVFSLILKTFKTNRLVDLALQQDEMKGTIDDVHEMMLEKKLEEWLRSPPDMRQKQHETQKLRREGTGRWFLEGNAFVEWEDNPGLLWIQGASGTGKSVLSSSVIQKLIGDQQLFEDFGKSSAVAFFYFDFKAKDSNAVETAMRRIVLQISAQSPHPYKTLDEQYRLSRGQALPSYQELLRLLKELLRELGRTYIIFDALDECPDTEFGWLMDLISALRGWSSSPLHLLITSQPRAGLTEKLGDVPGVFLESSFTQRDIELFIASELRENLRLKTWASRSDEIVHRVVHKSNGMFRLAACLLLELSRCKRQNELDRTLETLPNDLFGIYDRFLESVRPEDLIYVTGVLRWLIFSAQNLTLAEIADAIAFDFSDPTHPVYDPSVWEDNTSAIPDWLEGLATVRDYNGRKTVVLAHGSVQDYLLSGRFANKFGFELSQGHSHAFIARSCMGRLLHFSDHPLGLDALPHYSLARYAATWWCHHLRRSRDQDQSGLASSVMLLLQDGSEQYNTLNYLRNFAYASHPVHPNSELNDFTRISPLHLCAEEGYIDGVRWLLQKGVDVNFQDDKESALQAASAGGHTEIVRLLLWNGADVNAKGGKHGTALQVACAAKRTDIVKLLLAYGADVNAEPECTFLGTALQAASWAVTKKWSLFYSPVVPISTHKGNTSRVRCRQL